MQRVGLAILRTASFTLLHEEAGAHVQLYLTLLDKDSGHKQTWISSMN